MTEHYFTSDPRSAHREKEVSVGLGGVARTFIAPSGTFSAEGLDRGTRVLLDTVAEPRGDTLVDVGCGWGPLALTMAYQKPDATVWAVDVNERALHAVTKNAESLGVGTVRAIHPEAFPENTPIDTLWSNPPIRIGKLALHELLAVWLNRLAPEGEAWLVVAKQLGADSLQRWINEGKAGPFQCARVNTAKGFRVFQVTRG